MVNVGKSVLWFTLCRSTFQQTVNQLKYIESKSKNRKVQDTNFVTLSNMNIGTSVICSRAHCIWNYVTSSRPLRNFLCQWKTVCKNQVQSSKCKFGRVWTQNLSSGFFKLSLRDQGSKKWKIYLFFRLWLDHYLFQKLPLFSTTHSRPSCLWLVLAPLQCFT